MNIKSDVKNNVKKIEIKIDEDQLESTKMAESL
jgi:hypothetical protein